MDLDNSTMRRRSLRLCKKRKTEKNPPEVVVVPVDLVIDILTRLPVEVVRRCLLVSKSWEEIIRSKVFIRSFPFRSSKTEPLRLLMGLNVRDDQTGRRNYCVFSSSSSLSSSWSSTSISTFFQSRLTSCSPTAKKPGAHYPTYYVNGLMSVGQRIFNPCTGKSITLPRLKTGRSRLVKSFFGYDPVNDEYKVLCTTKKMKSRLADPWSDFHVFTLGANQESWRLIHCSVPHRPRSDGLCMDGFVYYIAYTGTGQSLVRFDLNSEKIDIFASVSENIRTNRRVPTLINYYGKVATAIQPLMHETRIDLLVFQAGKQDFVERSIHNLPDRSLHMKGINHDTGDIIFAPYSAKDKAYVFCYNLKGDTYKKIKIQVDAKPYHNWFSEAMYFVGYVESLMLL